jgi:hypothetical protein
MFSQLGPLFKTTFRKAESNDTRQKIPHEERDQNSRKQNEDEKPASTAELWEDNTDVSIEALRAFLINFLKKLPEAQEIGIPDPLPQKNNNPRPKEPTRPTNTQNAKAVRAYQAQAAYTPSTAEKDKNNEKSTKTRPTIENKEMRDIYQLIDNLEILSNRGVQMLTIEKSGDFLSSLRHSVAKIL